MEQHDENIVGSAEIDQNWIEHEAIPRFHLAIRAATLEYGLTLEEQEDAFQDATIRLLRSSKVHDLASRGAWSHLHGYAYRIAYNTAIDQVRGRLATLSELETPQMQSDDPASETTVTIGGGFDHDRVGHPSADPLRVLLLREAQAETIRVLAQLQLVICELSDDQKRPYRTVLGLYLQLMQQDLTAQVERHTGDQPVASGEAKQPPTTVSAGETVVRSILVEMLGAEPTQPSAREARYDRQIAQILRNQKRLGGRDVETAGGSWVRRLVKSARDEVRKRYVERFGRPPGYLWQHGGS